MNSNHAVVIEAPASSANNNNNFQTIENNSNSHGAAGHHRLKFQEKELVWGKVRGHAWWPAIVGEINRHHPRDREMKYIVHFIGD